jgi:hypothetical protein
MKLNKLITIALALGITLPTVSFSPVAKAQGIPDPRFKITAFFTIDSSGDGPLDNTLEVYGKVKINNTITRSISRSSAQSIQAGQTLRMGELIVTTGTQLSNSYIIIDAMLMDRDTLGSDDDVFQALPPLSVNPLAVIGGFNSTRKTGEQTFFYRSGDGAEASTLHIRVERL